jgi:hypothetical protein
MSIFIDRTGERFGRLLVISLAGRNKHYAAMWNVKCDCGNTKIVQGPHLKRGAVTSCGCLRATRNSMSGHPLYLTWRGMNRRCYEKQRGDYKRYGGRGITICSEWKDDYCAFIEWGLSHGWKKGLQIDRIDNDGNYTPDNCRFVTGKVNCRNTRNNVIVKYKDFHGTLSELAENIGMRASTLYGRIVILKWSIDKAVTTPVRKINKKKTG